jgi:cytoplasmic iron level regulating protein YaaA (DUF328/UPF0246 family)
MLVFLSPAKTMEAVNDRLPEKVTHPVHIKQAKELMSLLKTLSVEEVAEIMKVSPKLAMINYDRYQQWSKMAGNDMVTPALLAYRGEVFNGLSADTLSDEELLWSQNHVRILSGLYGYLKPLDGVQPYRLELGIKWKTALFDSLYGYWGDRMKAEAMKELEKENTLLNLASGEYSKALFLKKLPHKVITPEFKDWRGDSYKVVTIYAKHQRGAMTRFIIQNRLTDVEDIKAYDLNGYHYNADESTSEKWVFTRES